MEYIPTYNEKVKYNFPKRRIRRGLFQLDIGKLINADVNGALNIMRKYFQKLSVACDSLIREIIGRGFVFQPVRVRIYPYKPSHKGSPVHITK